MANAYQVALILLSGRELSEHQLRERLTRRECEPDDIDQAVIRLLADGTVNDRRVALAVARRESVIRHRGRLRVLQKIREIGVADSIATAAVDEILGEIDENALLDRALERRLRGQAADTLDQKGRARIVRSLVGQGFRTSDILKRLRD